jgi:hypothetical protein
MKIIKLILITAILIVTNSCSSSGSGSCNEIVCGHPGGPDGDVYYLYRGTLEPDTCGSIIIEVNQTTYDYYEAKMAQNPEGYACWEGLK